MGLGGVQRLEQGAPGQGPGRGVHAQSVGEDDLERLVAVELGADPLRQGDVGVVGAEVRDRGVEQLAGDEGERVEVGDGGVGRALRLRVEPLRGGVAVRLGGVAEEGAAVRLGEERGGAVADEAHVPLGGDDDVVGGEVEVGAAAARERLERDRGLEQQGQDATRARSGDAVQSVARGRLHDDVGAAVGLEAVVEDPAKPSMPGSTGLSSPARSAPCWPPRRSRPTGSGA